MNPFKAESVEQYINWCLWLALLPWLLMLAAWGYFQAFSWWLLVPLEIMALWGVMVYIRRFRNRILLSYERSALHLEAIVEEEYDQWWKPSFPKGKVALLHQQLVALSTQMQKKKFRYDSHVFLVYQLIEQLDTPILVFDSRLQLTFGNDAFEKLHGEPWQMNRHVSADYLGLQYDKTTGNWQFSEQQRAHQWLIRHSEFIDSGQTYQLLVFTNIKSMLRANQLDAWQQIIRVLSHEIRNSLTPVSSLAESVSTRVESERDVQALSVISERCEHLQDFVGRYAVLGKKMPIDSGWVSLKTLSIRLQELYKSLTVAVKLNAEKVWADGVLLEQVLINLVKNAEEAGAGLIIFKAYYGKNELIIEIVDDGYGFSNLENAFVPLYTTKPQGQGIGLSFCRNIIEQHQGSLTLHNNTDKGLTACIKMPIKR